MRKIGVAVGYCFAIANEDDVKGIELVECAIKVKKDGEIYPLYVGKTYADSNLLDDVLDRVGDYLIRDYQID